MKILSALLLTLVSMSLAQRLPPGVNPQHYQNQQYQQQQGGQYQVPVVQQQVPVHQQQIPVQHQQVPIQQQQQQQQQQHQQVPIQQGQVPVQQQQHIPQQQVPVQNTGGHGHGHAHSGEPQILNAANIAHEKEHIQEHMEVPIDTSKMSEQELQFHYFKMHDADNNNKLDGCELIKSLIHWHEQGQKDPNTQASNNKIFQDDELVNLIDPILNMDDNNRDGYIDYPEFIRAQQKAAANSPK